MRTSVSTDITPIDGAGDHGDDGDREQPVRDHRSFSFREIGVERISIDTEPLTQDQYDLIRPTLAFKDGDDDSDWCHLVVYVENRSGAKFEVERHLIRYDGMIGSSTGNARLVGQYDWRPGVSEDSICPLCHHVGHGAGKCEYRTRWM